MNRKLEILSAELSRCQEELNGMTMLRSSETKASNTTEYVEPPPQHFKAIGKTSSNNTNIQDYIDTKKNKHKRGNIKNRNAYWPTYVLDPTVKTCPTWADSEDTRKIRFHQIDGAVDRSSHMGLYRLTPFIFRNGNFDSGCFPVNPVGITGISGRGQLGKWGPNHAADPIVTCIKDGKLIFVAIQRLDTKEWALPGGMVEAGDSISTTIKKEFGEEAMNSMQMTPEQKTEMENTLKTLFKEAKEVYKGYVDDPRNTDNAWMETVAMHVHVDPQIAVTFKLQAGDDAGRVKWKEYTNDIQLYASHKDFIEATVKNLVEQKTPGLPNWIVEKFKSRGISFPTSDSDPAALRR